MMQRSKQIVSRPFGREGDFDKLARFMRRVAIASDRPELNLHIGDLAWRCYRSDQFDASSVIHLWEDKETAELLGMGWYTLAHHGLDMVVDPDLQGTGLDKRVLRWGEMRFRNIPFDKRGYAQLKVQVHDWDKPKEELLTDAGFRPDMFHYVWYRFDLNADIQQPELPEGFEVRLLEPGEEKWRAKCHNKSFLTDDVTEESYAKLQETAVYQKQALDLVLVAPSGKLAGFALGWLDEERQIGIFEPLGVKPKYRRQGLGKGLVLAGLQQFKAAGMQVAQVYTESPNLPAQRLYRSVGFDVAGRQVDWTK